MGKLELRGWKSQVPHSLYETLIPDNYHGAVASWAGDWVEHQVVHQLLCLWKGDSPVGMTTPHRLTQGD